MTLSQRPARVDCGLSYTTGQATIARSAIVACYHLQATIAIARLRLVLVATAAYMALETETTVW